jgi:predicted HTH domain antitoxin
LALRLRKHSEIAMEVVNVSGLKNNPSEALRKARDSLVVVMNRDKPDAKMVGLTDHRLLDQTGVSAALATALFREDHLSLARSAHLAQMTAPEFSRHLSRLGIPVVSLHAAEAARDMDTLEEWLASS